MAALAQGSLIVIKGNNLGPDKTPTFSSYPAAVAARRHFG